MRATLRTCEAVGLTYCLGALQRKDAASSCSTAMRGRGYYDLQAAGSAEIRRGRARHPTLDRIQHRQAELAGYFAAIRARRGKRLAAFIPVRPH